MKTGISISAAILIATTGLAQAKENYEEQAQYKVTITNITQGINFTPILSTTHKRSMSLFHIGEPASDEMVEIAEAGNIAPLMEKLTESRKVYDVSHSDGLLTPGQSVTLTLGGSNKVFKHGRFSMAAMLLPTNDTFVSLNRVRLPLAGSVTYMAKAYDAGSEPNDELCMNIPGPTCGGEPQSPAVEGEGYIYPSPTTHGEGDLSVESFGWSGPVAKVKIQRLH